MIPRVKVGRVATELDRRTRLEMRSHPSEITILKTYGSNWIVISSGFLTIATGLLGPSRLVSGIRVSWLGLIPVLGRSLSVLRDPVPVF